MINKVILIGHLGGDPEVRYTNKATAVCNFNVATIDKWKDGSGNLQEKTQWHRIVVWGKQAEFCGKYLKKGSQVFIEGCLETRSYEDKNSGTKYITEVKAINVKSLGKREGGSYTEATQEASIPDEQNDSFSNEEIPF
mgnify:CR=1 FL=1